MDGWHGRYLRIDPRPGRTACVASGDRLYSDFRGGVGLGTWIVAHEMPAGTDPLVPEAALAYACSPLVGSPLTTLATFAVVALCPLTGLVCEALAASHFAIAAKRAGIDAPAITGACETLHVAFVEGMSTDDPRVEWRSAGPLRGLPAREAEDRLCAENGTDWQVAAIGPAGERLIPFATLSHDGRHAGRGGLWRSPWAQEDQGRGRPGIPPNHAGRPRLDGRARAASLGAVLRPRHRGVSRVGDRRQPADLQPLQQPAEPQLPFRPHSKGPVGWPPRTWGRRVGSRRPRSPPVRSVSNTSPRSAAGRMVCGWSTNRCSRSARSAGSTTRRRSCSPRACDDAGLDTISTGGPSPSLWTSPSGAGSTAESGPRLGFFGSAMVLPCSKRSQPWSTPAVA